MSTCSAHDCSYSTGVRRRASLVLVSPSPVLLDFTAHFASLRLTTYVRKMHIPISYARRYGDDLDGDSRAG